MPDKLRINTLFILPQLSRGGSETLVYDLARMMDRSRFHPSLSYLRDDGNRDFINEFQKNNIKVYSTPKHFSIDLGLMRKLSGIVEKDNIKIINAHHFISMVYSFYARKRNKKVRLVYTEHSKWEVGRIPLKWRIIGNYLLSHIDAAVGVTDEISEAIRRRFFLRKLKVLTIENGIELDRFSHPYDRMLLRSNFGFDSSTVVIGIVANFRKIKNHILLLKAFDALIAARTNLKLMLVGQGFKGDPESSEDEINKFVKASGIGEDVLFMGYRTDVPELLAVMDIFCLTSLNEGLPISLIEAMATGLPIVGTDVNGIRGVVKHGVNGFLVDPWDSTGLQNALRALVDNKERRIAFGENSRKVAVQFYSIQRCVSQYQDLFFSLHIKDQEGDRH